MSAVITGVPAPFRINPPPASVMANCGVTTTPAAVADTGVFRVKETFGTMETMVEPALMPAPDTFMPTERPAVLAVVIVAELSVVAPVTVAPLAVLIFCEVRRA